MGNKGARVDAEAASGDELGSGTGSGSAPSGGGAPSAPDTKDALGKHVVPSDDADGSPGGSGGPPPGTTDEDQLADPKDSPPTVADDGGVDGSVGAGGSGGGGGGGLFGGLADAYDQAEDLAHETYDDVEEEAAETYEDASTWESGEHRGTLDVAASDFVDDAARASSDVIDDAARDAGDAFRDSGDAVNELYDHSGVGPVVADAREAGAVVVPDVVEDVYDQGEDLAHQTYDDVVEEVVETYEDASVLETQGEHWGGMAGMPDRWLEPLLDGAENVAETPGDWYEKSGVEDFGTGNSGGVAGESSVPDVDDHGRGDGSGALAPNAGLAGGADETAELAGKEEAQRLTADIANLAADPGPIEVPDDPFEASEVIEVADPMEPETAGEWDEPIELV